jgi:hypothetical protein
MVGMPIFLTHGPWYPRIGPEHECHSMEEYDFWYIICRRYYHVGAYLSGSISVAFRSRSTCTVNDTLTLAAKRNRGCWRHVTGNDSLIILPRKNSNGEYSWGCMCLSHYLNGTEKNIFERMSRWCISWASNEPTKGISKRLLSKARSTPPEKHKVANGKKYTDESKEVVVSSCFVIPNYLSIS